VNHEYSSKLDAPSRISTQFTRPYWSLNIQRQTELAAIAGIAHGSTTSTVSSARPRKRWLSSSATAIPNAIVTATATVPNTTVLISARRSASSANTSR